MAQLIRFWLELCLLRAAPQDMSASRLVLGVSVCSYALVSVLLATLSYGFHDGVRMALLELSLPVMYVAGVLYLLSRGGTHQAAPGGDDRQRHPAGTAATADDHADGG